MGSAPLAITCVSDTHTKHEHIQLPAGDILIHAGDCTIHGTREETFAFLDWFKLQPYSFLILIAGNHDRLFELSPEYMQEECMKRNIHLLNDSQVKVEGLKIWGSPITPWYENLAFNRQRGAEIRGHWDLIPPDTDILVTHGPPHGILDRVPRFYSSVEHTGCEELAKRLKDLSVKLHVFGHIHEDRGTQFLQSTLFINASSVNVAYQPYHPSYTRLIKRESSICVVS